MVVVVAGFIPKMDAFLAMVAWSTTLGITGISVAASLPTMSAEEKERIRAMLEDDDGDETQCDTA
jgi:hypothetical protein